MDRAADFDLETPDCTPHLRTDSPLPPIPLSHLHQNILALSREHVFEPVKGEVVGHADGGTRGVTHVVRAVPLPVLTDTRNRNGRVAGMRGVRGVRGPCGHWGMRRPGRDRMFQVPPNLPGSLKKWGIQQERGKSCCTPLQGGN